MNYEKKYKEALERMKSWVKGEHPECFSEAQKAAEFIFPELKESEDEKIRKELIAIYSVGAKVNAKTGDIPDRDIVAWLEKQGKENNTYTINNTPNCGISVHNEEFKESKDERIRKTIYGWIYTQPSEFFDNGFSKEEMLAWVEKQNKQSSSNIPSRETILAVWELGNDWKELTNGSISTEYGTKLEYIQNHWQESTYYDNIMEGGGR